MPLPLAACTSTREALSAFMRRRIPLDRASSAHTQLGLSIGNTFPQPASKPEVTGVLQRLCTSLRFPPRSPLMTVRYAEISHNAVCVQ